MAMKISVIVALLCLSAPSAVVAQLCEADCSGDECVFHASVNLTAGQLGKWRILLAAVVSNHPLVADPHETRMLPPPLGYFVFDECPDQISPILAIEVKRTYRFVQSQVFNYFHPLGFAYYADGAHADEDELEPGIAPPGTNSTCAETLSCPAPMYFVNGTYLGTYSNDASILNVTTGEDNFGLDDYEPRFFYPFTEWLEQGDDDNRFSVTLKFTEENYTQDIFYFCHVSTGTLWQA